jgi:Rrf2 family protein
MVVLDQFEEEGPVPASALADTYGLPLAYLNKQLQMLVRHGLVTSTSGPAGGFSLARPAGEITLVDVVDAVAGRAPLFQCTEIRCQGVFESRAEEICTSGPCGIASAMLRAEDAWRASLSAVSVRDLGAGIDSESARQMGQLIQGDEKS